MIKITLIAIGIGSIGYIVIDYIIHLQEHSDLEIGAELEREYLDSFEIESGFGTIELFEEYKKQSTKIGEASLTYADENLGFKISRPNLSWSFDANLDEIVQDNTESLISNGFSGGIYVEQNNEKTFFVAVFDISNQEQFLLEDYVNTQTDYLQEKFDAEDIVRAVSPNNEWAIFGIKINFGESSAYGEQLLQIHNDNLYMLQYTGTSPENLSNEDIEERRSIIDSFTLI